jgi:hypothetical protein
VIASDARLVDGTVGGDPTEDALLVLAHKAGLHVDGTREKYPRMATLPFDPLQAHGHLQQGRVLTQCIPSVYSSAHERLLRTSGPAGA